MSIKLSICIPTYNRSKYLQECLISILSSAQGKEQQIEVIISDNASTDSTINVVRTFQKHHPWIHYQRNDINIGAERNFIAVSTAAKGEYIWIFGDDDKMEREAIERVLASIQCGYGLIIFNYSIWDKNFSVRNKMDGLHIGKDQFFEDPNELMKHFSFHLGYISSVIIKKTNFFKLSYHEYETFIDYGFPFMYSVYTGVANKNCRAKYISTPIVCNRSGNSGGYDWHKYFVAGSSLIFDALALKGYSNNAVRSAKHNVLRNSVLLNFVYVKLHDEQSIYKVFCMLFKYYKMDWLFWFGCLPLFISPVFIVRCAKKTFLMVRQARAFLFAISP
jgi:abequosyltransferase